MCILFAFKAGKYGSKPFKLIGYKLDFRLQNVPDVIN